MANKEQLKSILISLGSLAIQVRDRLAESHDQDTYTNLLDELKQSINNVEQITAEVAEEMSQVDEGEVYASLSNARGWQVKLLERVNFIKSFSTNVNVVTKKNPGRLPEVKLTVFKGNFEEWETFWSSFRTNVDVWDDIEKTTKFINLVQSLEGEPKEMINGLAITDDNYNVVLYILRDRYENASKQTNVLMQKFHTMPTFKYNPKDLRVFLTEYRKIKHQLSRVLDFRQSELVIKSIVVRKLLFQTFDRICDIYVTHDFMLDQMETGIQHIVDKLEQAVLALAEGATIKQVGVNSQSQNQSSKQSKPKANQRCSYYSGEHLAHECAKYKTVNSRKGRVMQLRLCYNCLTPGHSSKTCHSTKTCRTCGSHHHSSLCFKAHSNSSDTSNQNTSSSIVSQGKTNQSSSSTSIANQRSFKAQAQTHPNKPVVTPNKSNASQASNQSPTIDTTYVTSVNSINFPNNVLTTATLNVGYCNQQANVRAFFDTGSHRSFISPEVVKRLNLRVIKQVPVNLSTFGNKTESCMLDLVKVKIRLGKIKIPLTMLVHDSAAMGYFHSPGLYEVAQKLESKGFNLADHNITSDALTGIEMLIGVDNFTRLIVR